MKFCSGGEKRELLAATGVKMGDNDISSIKCVTREFLEVPRCTPTKQRQRMYKKSVLLVQSCFFAN